MDVVEDVPASEVLRPGDVIISVNGEPVTLPDELRAALGEHAPGDSVTLGIRRSSVSTGESASSGEESFDSLTVDVELVASRGWNRAPATTRPGSRHHPTTQLARRHRPPRGRCSG
ncbi:MAG: PDZ domain-containing protein [Microthrixaceae bacterium]|nr:PDZ domain-containing protein [Microthrixaceae bacterium]